MPEKRNTLEGATGAAERARELVVAIKAKTLEFHEAVDRFHRIRAEWLALQAEALKLTASLRAFWGRLREDLGAVGPSGRAAAQSAAADQARPSPENPPTARAPAADP